MSLWKFLWMYSSLWCFLLNFLLVYHFLNIDFNLLDSSFNSFFSFKHIWENLEIALPFNFYSDNQCDHSHSQASCISNSHPWDGIPFLPPSEASMGRAQWGGNSNAKWICHCLRLPIYQALYIHLLLIPKISYLKRVWLITFHHYCWRGEWDHTWSYGLSTLQKDRIFI